MHRAGTAFQIRVSEAARRDVRALLKWSEREFGRNSALRYEALLTQALLDIARDAERAGSMGRPDVLIAGARTYHIAFSRTRVKGRRVKAPRHFLLYRVHEEHVIEVGRVIHDSCDLVLHLPDEYRRGE